MEAAREIVEDSHQVSAAQRTADRILRETLRWAGCAALDETTFPEHRARLAATVEARRPIVFCLPAFPAKAENRGKTLGADPDLGEVAALVRLEAFCASLAELYSPGARLLLASDGRVFGATVGIREESITGYQSGVADIIERLQLRHIDTYTLEDAFGDTAADELRTSLLADFGEAPEAVRRSVEDDPSRRALFDGLHRFLFEDAAAREKDRSRSAVRKEQKELAYEVLRRSEAWSRFLAHRFPSALRLSIHPQRPAHPVATLGKLPFRLLPSQSVWATPWHRAPLWDGERLVLVRNEEAQAEGARLQWFEDRWAYWSLRGTPTRADFAGAGL